jgi:hypothetical protein
LPGIAIYTNNAALVPGFIWPATAFAPSCINRFLLPHFAQNRWYMCLVLSLAIVTLISLNFTSWCNFLMVLSWLMCSFWLIWLQVSGCLVCFSRW